MKLSPTVEARLNAKLDKHTTACWLWTGSTTKKGYGQIANCGSPRLVHRIAYALYVGPIPEGAQVDHTCYVRNCCNPEHLRPVTPKQNSENRKGAQTNSKSGVRGVCWNRNRQMWRARVEHGGVQYEVGFYDDLVEADTAVRAKRQELFTHTQN